MSQSPHPPPTQAKRRVLYGLNVFIMVLVATAIVVLVNVISAWTLSEGRARLDVTQTRRYSLSEQTRHVLKDLQSDFRLVTLFNGAGEAINQANTLTDLYGQYSDRVKVEHIRPALDLGRRGQFCAELLKRYESQLQPVDKAARAGLAAVESLHKEIQQQLDRLRPLQDNAGLPEGDVRKLVNGAMRSLSVVEDHLNIVEKSARKALEEQLPNYAMALTNTRDYLADEPAKVLPYAAQQFADKAKAASSPAAAQFADPLKAVADGFEAARKNLEPVLKELADVKTVAEYDTVRDQLSQEDANVVVVLGPKQVQVLDIQQMFRPPSRRRNEEDAKPQMLEFQGEEKVTGALVSMSMTQPPLVVFVSPSPRPALGPEGRYGSVGEQLKAMNFRVEEWSPTPQSGPEGMMAPPPKLPEPEPGQKAVWILLPGDGSNGGNPYAGMMGEAEAARVVGERLAKGDAALLLLSFSPMAAFSGPSPILQTLETWGIKPQLDRIVLRELQVARGQPQPTNYLEVSTWPGDLPVTKAIAGMTALFPQACPLEIDKPKDPAIKLWPLAQATGPNLWAETNLNGDTPPQRDPKTAKDSYTLGVAAQRDQQRLIVFGDAFWPTDQVMTISDIGVRFPANSELFANSVYWLAGQDQLIAASARTQDIRRIHHEFSLYNRFILSMVLLGSIIVVVTGLSLGVWMVRRRS